MDPRMERLLDEIDADMRATADWTGRGALAPRVRAALAAVPRHAFVPPGEQASAYENVPRPIGHGQTISQPYIVALMTELLDPAPDDRALEVGTGCGYQAAVLSRLVAEVYTIETVPALADAARDRLARMGYGNVHVRHGDGAAGWPAAAPFDGIIVTAAAREVPRALLDQLAPGGRMVIPVGAPYGAQDLIRITKDAAGATDRRVVLPVAFVPLVGGREDGPAKDHETAT